MTAAVAKIGAALAAATLLVGQPARAAPAAGAGDLAAIQQQLNALRAEYDAKIAALEARLKAAEDEAAAARAAAPAATAEPSAPPEAPSTEVVIQDEPAPPTVSANASNPGVSVVLNGNYVATSRNPDGARIAGFPLSGEAGLFPRGFSLGESELTFAANVDPFLFANLTASISRDDDISVEEAYIQTTTLPAGLTLKAGRFFSAIGYLNERHAHNWSFIDMSLPYRALLGNQYGDDGVQLRWLAPTPFFLEVGGELFRGDSFPAANGDKARPGTQTAFVHAGSDINDSSSWLAALSYIHADARGRETDADTFNGRNDLGIASLVYKWAPGGNLADRNLTLSGEYFFGREHGAFDGVATARDQRGWYAQGVYQFLKGWSAGLRYAQLDEVKAPALLAGSTLDGLGHTPRAFSALFEHDTSEFGRFRIQFTHDTADVRHNDLFLFQYTVLYGPHAAHRY
jgi:hypothetical protein